jgi:hypothetical protein
LAVSAELSAVALFKLLGWAFAEDGRKCKAFATRCEALGVAFDLDESKAGICKVTNTESRAVEISLEIHRILDAGSITQLEALKLRGRMQFAESQIYGRTGKRCVASLRDFACRRRSKVFGRDAMFLPLFVSLVKSGNPRKVGSKNKHTVVMFTDACYEPESRDRVCGLGGVLIDHFSGAKLFFSCVLDDSQRNVLGEANKKQIISKQKPFAQPWPTVSGLIALPRGKASCTLIMKVQFFLLSKDPPRTLWSMRWHKFLLKLKHMFVQVVGFQE